MAVKAEWIRELERAKACKRTAELTRRLGRPGHRVTTGGVEIWHYPLGTSGGMAYSIHVAVDGERLTQAYMHMEPSSTVDDPAAGKRPWWKFW